MQGLSAKCGVWYAIIMQAVLFGVQHMLFAPRFEAMIVWAINLPFAAILPIMALVAE